MGQAYFPGSLDDEVYQEKMKRFRKNNRGDKPGPDLTERQKKLLKVDRFHNPKTKPFQVTYDEFVFGSEGARNRWLTAIGIFLDRRFIIHASVTEDVDGYYIYKIKAENKKEE